MTLLDSPRTQRRIPPAAREPRLRDDWLLVAALVLGYAFLQSAFVHHPIMSDQLHYLVDANTLPEISFPPHHGLRIGLTIPVWFFIQLFDYSEAAYYAVPYLTMVGLVVSVYWLGRLLDSRTAGVIAGVVVVANPLVLDESSQLLPDMPAATLLTAAVTLLVWQLQRAPATAALTRGDRLTLIGVGVLLGWAYLIREFIVIWFPVVLLVALVTRVPRSHWRLIAAGAGGMVGVELLWGLVFFGNPFARIWASLNQPASEPWRVVQRTELIAQGDIPNTHLDMLTAMPRNILALDAGWIFVLFVVLVVVAALLVRSPQLRLLALWVVVPIVLLTVVIQVAWLFDNRILRAEKLRYWLPMIPPVAVGGVVAILALGRWLAGVPGRRVATGVAVLLTLASLVLTGAELDERTGFTRTRQDQFLELREWVATSGQSCDVLWVDADQWRASTRWVPMYLRTFWGTPIWDGELRPLNSDEDFVDITELDDGALVRSKVAIRRRRLEGLTIPGYLAEPPDSWQVLLATAGDRVNVYGIGDSACAP